jgi:hypothetical protein
MQGRKEITPKMLYQVYLNGKQKSKRFQINLFLAL